MEVYWLYTAKYFKNSFAILVALARKYFSKSDKNSFNIPRLKKSTDDLNLIREWKNFIVGQTTASKMSERMREGIKQARCVSLR